MCLGSQDESDGRGGKAVHWSAWGGLLANVGVLELDGWTSFLTKGAEAPYGPNTGPGGYYLATGSKPSPKAKKKANGTER